MKSYHLHEAKVRLSELIEAVEAGEEIVITRYGKPVAKLVALLETGPRELGFHPIAFTSDLLAPTDDELLDEFDGGDEGWRVRYLLDTHTLAWAVGDPDRLGARVRSLLLDRENVLLISPASIWEMSIRHHCGRWPEVAPFMEQRSPDAAR